MIAEMKTSMKKLENKFEELSQKVGRKRERDGKLQNLLLMILPWNPETCRATQREMVRNTQVGSSGI